MRDITRRIFVVVLCLTVVGTLVGACAAPAATPTAAPPTKAPAAEPTKAPVAEPTKAPAAEPTKSPTAAEAGKLGPMPQIQPTTVQWAAGGVGGGWYALSASIAELVKQEVPNLQINVVPGAGIANHPRVAKNDVQFAMGFPSLAKALMDGSDPYKPEDKSPDIRAVLAGLSITHYQFAVAEDVPINSFEEFIQKKYPLKIAVDRVGTTDEWCLRLSLKFYNLTYDDIKKWGGNVIFTGYSDHVTQLKDKHVDAVWQNMTVPSPTLTEVMTTRKLKFLPLPEPLRQHLITKYAFADRTIPAGVYGDKPIPTVATITTLMTNSKVPDDIVYIVNRVMCENYQKVQAMQASAKIFDPTIAFKETGADLHPGALKYFKEKGYVK